MINAGELTAVKLGLPDAMATEELESEGSFEIDVNGSANKSKGGDNKEKPESQKKKSLKKNIQLGFDLNTVLRLKKQPQMP